MADVKTIQLEVMFAGWQDHHAQGPRIVFWLPDDADLEQFRALTVKKGRTAGHRFMMVLAEIGDDEKPVPEDPMKKRHLSSEAHLLVTGTMFKRYVISLRPDATDWDTEKVRRWVKHKIEVESLSELDSDPAAAKRYDAIIRRPFAEWAEYGERDDLGPTAGLAEDARGGDSEPSE